MSKAVRGVLRMMGALLLMLGVTVGGVMAGALFTSPAATSMPWIRPAVAIVAALVAIVALVVWLKPASPASPAVSAGAKTTKSTTKSTAKSAARNAPAFSMPTISMPSLSLGGKADRTPRAVQALAAAGTAPSEISWRTGLPLDAVALLLAMSTTARQLQPPTA